MHKLWYFCEKNPGGNRILTHQITEVQYFRKINILSFGISETLSGSQRIIVNVWISISDGIIFIDEFCGKISETAFISYFVPKFPLKSKVIPSIL
jgi:hypothetical protein